LDRRKTTTFRTRSSSIPFLQWRAGAFGSSSRNNEDDASTTTTESSEDEKPARRFGRRSKRKKIENNGPPIDDSATSDSVSSSSSNENDNNSNEATVEEYVAAMKERDEGHDPAVDEEHQDRDRQGEDSSSGGHSSLATFSKQDIDRSTPQDSSKNSAKSSGVGVKSHKKSNAVGDPDDDDDDDDDDESQSEYSDEWEDLDYDEEYFEDVEPLVEVELELMEESTMSHQSPPKDEPEDNKSSSRSGIKGGGGVGVRLGRMANRRKTQKSKASPSPKTKASVKEEPPAIYDSALLERAWNPFVYFPPSTSALSFLSEHARVLDAASKNRLDRRTLYAGLLLEWGATSSKLTSNTRKFLPLAASQALQAALSMATQPGWRKSAPRTNGIRLYPDEGEATTSKASTLGMQETISMALVSF